jgi:hypothetical protein
MLVEVRAGGAVRCKLGTHLPTGGVGVGSLVLEEFAGVFEPGEPRNLTMQCSRSLSGCAKPFDLETFVKRIGVRYGW